MKYLVIGTRNTVPMDPKIGAGLFQACKQWVSAELAAGKGDAMYIYADASGGIEIGNANSHEEVYDRLLDFPMYAFMDWEVIPLVDWSHGYDKMIEFCHKIAART